MKKSELKALIREVIEEIHNNEIIISCDDCGNRSVIKRVVYGNQQNWTCSNCEQTTHWSVVKRK